MKPKRIQRKRTKGWRMPPNTVYVGRPSRWGNRYKVGSYYWVVDWEGIMTHEFATRYFEDAIKHNLKRKKMVKRELKGKNLCCWCPLDQPCHADILLEIANENTG